MTTKVKTERKEVDLMKAAEKEGEEYTYKGTPFDKGYLTRHQDVENNNKLIRKAKRIILHFLCKNKLGYYVINNNNLIYESGACMGIQNTFCPNFETAITTWKRTVRKWNSLTRKSSGINSEMKADNMKMFSIYKIADKKVYEYDCDYIKDMYDLPSYLF